MGIISADVVVNNPARNIVILTFTTDEGLTGLNDVTVNGCPPRTRRRCAGFAPGPSCPWHRYERQHRVGLPDARHRAAQRPRALRCPRELVTAMTELVGLSVIHQLKPGFYGRTDIPPIRRSAGIHLDLAIHSFDFHEYLRHGDLTNDVFRQGLTVADGYLHPGDSPVLEVELDEDSALRFLYSRALLPSLGFSTERRTTDETGPFPPQPTLRRT